MSTARPRRPAADAAISVFDLFTVGIGPSSSHSVGPMRAARLFLDRVAADPRRADVARLTVHLYGSLALTGIGHGTDRAVVMGLIGERPESIDPDAVGPKYAAVAEAQAIEPWPGQTVGFDPESDLVFHRKERLPAHANGLRFVTADAAGRTLHQHDYYSIGGGFVLDPDTLSDPPPPIALPYPFGTAAELLAHCEGAGLPVSGVMLENEKTWWADAEIRAGLLRIWAVMRACVEKGCRTEGILPGGLEVVRRAPDLHRRLMGRDAAAAADPLAALEWVDLFALAVNEENAAGGRVVTAPTNGAAGIIPAVLHFYDRFCPGASEDGVVRFLLTAAAIGTLYKKNASISGAEVGCQGEVGVACSMAAGGLAEVLGGTPAHVDQAAEIGMEHNLGLTCDPIGGLVQVPCIERNAMGAVKAINAARLALAGTGRHQVSLDRVIDVMRRTGRDMSDKYKETSRGGLAVNVPEC